MATTDYRRIPDDLVLQADGLNPRFEDCGIFALDCRRRPFLLVCAGHGGCGTLACVRQLRDVEPIEELLEASRESAEDAAAVSPGADRVFAVVAANRRRRSTGSTSRPYAIDDLELESFKIVWASRAIESREWA